MGACSEARFCRSDIKRPPSAANHLQPQVRRSGLLEYKHGSSPPVEASAGGGSPISSPCDLTGRYLGGMIASLEIWSWLMLSLILDTNLGVWPLTICRISGLNS